MMTLVGAWLVGTALALAPGEELELTLVGDVVVAGTFRTTDGEQLVLTVDGEPLEVALGLVEQATRDGLSLEPADLRAEAAVWAAAQVPPGPVPHPLLAGTASALLPGSGHLLLGDWRTWAGYAVVDGSLLALASWYAFREQAPRATATFLLLDGIFRVYAVREAVRDAQTRRPADRIGLRRGLGACQGWVSVLPLPGRGVTAAATYRCGGPARLDPTGPIH